MARLDGVSNLAADDRAMQIEKIVLQTDKVRLEPLTATHLPGLAAAIHDGALWESPWTTVPHPDRLADFLAAADAQFSAGRELAFASIDVATGAVAGSTRFRQIDRQHRRVEIGSTFIARSWQRTHLNTGAKLLMLQHAFDTWRCIRVELLTDVLNGPSRAAIVRLGAVEEGVLRSHMRMRDGRLRDSVIHGITVADWPTVKAALQAKRHAADTRQP